MWRGGGGGDYLLQDESGKWMKGSEIPFQQPEGAAPASAEDPQLELQSDLCETVFDERMRGTVGLFSASCRRQKTI